ncbi:MAG: alpha-galactosidase [Clostridiales bacterium]|nr:alpha-galactosidase [Clostridiales bacterium]
MLKAPQTIKYSAAVTNSEGGSSYEEEYAVGYSPLTGWGHGAVVRAVPVFEKGSVAKAEAYLDIELPPAAKIFMNGYQTWTYCPEYTAKSRIRGIKGLPGALVSAFSLDRYGDYHFVDYPNKKGRLHGVSYCYFREGPFFLLIASLDETNGYTLFDYDAKTGVLTIKRDCEGLAVNGAFELFSLFIAEGKEDEVFDAWFREMGVSPITKDPIAGYSSWYNRYQNISRETILDDLSGCAKVMKSGDLFQIDDGWETFVGDWLDCDRVKFPDGMKASADAIHQKGYKAGLWLAPFVAQKGSKLIKEHPDWLYKHNGEPWSCGCNWGGFYSLDIDNPEVVAYIEEVFGKVFNEWGFDLVKLDFLYGAAPFGSDLETRAGRMIRAMKLLRRVCGHHAILGCGVPVMPAFGLVEYCRISCDVSLDWNDKPWMRILHRERVSTKQAMGNTVFRRELNGRAYLSDPDVFFLRENNIRLSDARKLKLATVNALFGGVFLTSDNIGDYNGAAISDYRRLNALRGAEVKSVETVGKKISVTYTAGESDAVITF